MNKHQKKFALLHVVFVLLSTLVYGQQANEKALLWKISGNGLQESSYLFGTYHLLGESFLSEVPEIEAPFKNAKGIVVEIVVDSSKLMSVAMMGIMRDNKISNLITDDDFKLVSDELERVSNINLKSVDMFKPSQINIILAVLQAKKINEKVLAKYPGVPLDMHFANEGKKQGKVVTPLESMEEQSKLMFDHFPVEEQARQLVEYVKHNDLVSKTNVDMANLYLQKDLKGLLTIMESYPEKITGNSDFLLKDRNTKWIEVLPSIMNTGSQFIAVGAGHLPGGDGLISLLRQKGYKVEPVLR